MTQPLVITCLWQRPHNLPKIITALENQTHANFSFILWNNNYALKAQVEGLCRQSTLSDFQIIHCKENLYGYARFLAVRKHKGNPIIFFDDDQIPHLDFVQYMTECHERYGSRHLCSWWGRQIYKELGYWGSPMATPGQIMNYSGTGGMVFDRMVLDTTDIEETWPLKYRPSCQDIWFSCAAYVKLGISGICIDRKLEHFPDKFDTYKKPKMFLHKEAVVKRLYTQHNFYFRRSMCP
jgi:hypothetical protein